MSLTFFFCARAEEERRKRKRGQKGKGKLRVVVVSLAGKGKRVEERGSPSFASWSLFVCFLMLIDTWQQHDKKKNRPFLFP